MYYLNVCFALIKFSAGVGAASGKAGGIVFSRNRGGAYMKNFTIPTNPNTEKQQAVRSVFGALSTAWRGLTKAQQTKWETMAPQYPYVNRVGDVKILSGQALFVRLNSQLIMNLGAAQINEPLIPVELTDTQVTSGTFEILAGLLDTMEIDMNAVGSADESWIVLATPPMSGGITKPAKSAFKKLQVVADASLSNTIDIKGAYLDLYGEPVAGDNVFVRVQTTNKLTGQNGSNGQIIFSAEAV